MPSSASASMSDIYPHDIPIAGLAWMPNHIRRINPTCTREGRLTLNECDNLADRTSNLAQSIADMLGSTGNCWASAGRNLGKTFGSLGGSLLSCLLGLGGRLSGGRVVSDGGSADEEP